MQLQQFLNSSYTAYHTTANVLQVLRQNGFEQLVLGQNWQLKQGGKYFVTRNDSSVVAFRVGQSKVFNVCASHTDSPSFKLKGNKVVGGDLNRLNTEKYGGGLLYSFLDRPLKIAGRVLVETPFGVNQQLVCSSYNVVIPSLAIHQNPTANDGMTLNAQNDTLPLFSQGEADLYASLVDGTVLDADLYVVPATEAFFAGANNEFLCSARLDNLTSVYASVDALTNCVPSGISVAACLDNEEIGSGTRQGTPDFVKQVLLAVANALGWTETEKQAAFEQGFVLSVDNSHAAHPAHPQKADPQNKNVLNGGVVIKHHVNYATDGLTAALLKKLLNLAKVPYQDFYNRSDARCGSTMGLATANKLGIKVCDIGIAQLAMHSACETCGAKDVANITNCLKAFLSATFVCNGADYTIQL